MPITAPPAPACRSRTTLRANRSPRALAVRLASRAEQEIRAYPRLYAAFYKAVTSNPTARDLVGRAKDQVRSSGLPPVLLTPLAEEPEVASRRRSGVAARLRLSLEADR